MSSEISGQVTSAMTRPKTKVSSANDQRDALSSIDMQSWRKLRSADAWLAGMGCLLAVVEAAASIVV